VTEIDLTKSTMTTTTTTGPDQDRGGATRQDADPAGARRLAPGPRVVSLQGVWERLGTPFLRSVVAAVVFALVAAAAAGTVALTRPATYRSQAILLIDQPAAVAVAPDEGVLLKLTTLRAKYAALAGTSDVLQGAARLSNLDTGTVAHDSQVGFGQNALTMASQGLSPDPATARLVAQDVGQALSIYVSSEQAALRIPPVDRVTLTVIQPAGAAVKISPTKRRVAAVAVIALLVGGLLAYGVAQLVSTRRWQPRLG
jgi:hypothetical protein